MTGEDLLRMICDLPGDGRRHTERVRSVRTTCDAVIEALEANGLEIVPVQDSLLDEPAERFSEDVVHRGGLV